MDCEPVTNPTKARVAASFGAASDAYSNAAGLQFVVAEALAGRIAELSLPPRPRILELGCGTGFLNFFLRRHLIGPKWLVSDIAYPMVNHCHRQPGNKSDTMYLVMDAERPAVCGGFDLICASLVFQWLEDMPRAISGLAGLLRPGGHIVFSTLADGSLAEWRQAHLDLGLRAATPEYPGIQKIKSMWNNGPADVQEEKIVRVYQSSHAFVRAIKAIGANTPAPRRPALGPGSLRRVLRHLDRRQKDVTMTYHIAYGFFTKDGK